jgi:hypothetical protein
MRIRGKANQCFGRHFQYMKIIEGAQNQFEKRICVKNNEKSFNKVSTVQYAVTRSLCGARLVS